MRNEERYSLDPLARLELDDKFDPRLTMWVLFLQLPPTVACLVESIFSGLKYQPLRLTTAPSESIAAVHLAIARPDKPLFHGFGKTRDS